MCIRPFETCVDSLISICLFPCNRFFLTFWRNYSDYDWLSVRPESRAESNYISRPPLQKWTKLAGKRKRQKLQRNFERKTRNTVRSLFSLFWLDCSLRISCQFCVSFRLFSLTVICVSFQPKNRNRFPPLPMIACLRCRTLSFWGQAYVHR